MNLNAVAAISVTIGGIASTFALLKAIQEQDTDTIIIRGFILGLMIFIAYCYFAYTPKQE